MIGLIGIKKNVPLEIREKFALKDKDIKNYLEKLSKKIDEVVIISTCNRTEIYFYNKKNMKEDDILNVVLSELKIEKHLKNYLFVSKEEEGTRHLFEVVCGFHSKILGEDQILGQVRDSFFCSLELKTVGKVLDKLFREAISCGKKFRKMAALYEIPVSSASIAVNALVKNRAKVVMVLGYGEIGKLVCKGLISHKVPKIIVVVRDKNKGPIEDENIKVCTFLEKNTYIKEIDGVVSCTKAPHTVLKKEDFKEYDKRHIDIYDLAVPRDVESDIENLGDINIFNIDEISKIDDENKKLRRERMFGFRWIIEEYVLDFLNWRKLNKLSNTIKSMKSIQKECVEKRYKKIQDKEGENSLAKTMLNSMGNLYVNKAIEVLKEESLKGSDDECLRIIKKIFLEK